MIIKNFELERIKKSNLSLYLFYGQNEGLKKEVLVKEKKETEILI